MKLSNSLFLSTLLLVGQVHAFSVSSMQARQCSTTTTRVSTLLSATTMAEAGVPPTTSEPTNVADEVEIPTNLPSEVGMDYVPLATMLATGQLAEADQVRKNDALHVECNLCMYACEPAKGGHEVY